MEAVKYFVGLALICFLFFINDISRSNDALEARKTGVFKRITTLAIHTQGSDHRERGVRRQAHGAAGDVAETGQVAVA